MVSQDSKTSRASRELGQSETGPESRMKGGKGRKSGGKPRKSRPLDETSLRDLALAYAARFSTTQAKLEAYLQRKLRERGVAEDADGRPVALDIKALSARLVELGYVNDDDFARARSRDLTARGYGAKRVDQALYAAGVEEQTREAHAPGEAASRRAVMLLAKKRRFGPYGLEPLEQPDEDEQAANPLSARKLYEKQLAAMLRAGHSYSHVRFILDASQVDEVEEWLAEAEADEAENGQQEDGIW